MKKMLVLFAGVCRRRRHRGCPDRGHAVVGPRWGLQRPQLLTAFQALRPI